MGEILPSVMHVQLLLRKDPQAATLKIVSVSSIMQNLIYFAFVIYFVFVILQTPKAFIQWLVQIKNISCMWIVLQFCNWLKLSCYHNSNLRNLDNKIGNELLSGGK